MFLLVPVVVILGFFSLSNQAIGLRYVLPIYPFLFVFAGGAVPWLSSSKALIGLTIGLLAWSVAAAGYVYPHFLAYFNEAVGGPSQGYRYLVDSNLDWGQDLKGLKRFMDERDISRIHLSYFGSDTPARYGIAYDWLPSYLLDNPTPGKFDPSPKGWVAVSATTLQGVHLSNKDLFAWFRQREPVAKIGYSIFIYRTDR
jgi:hypothetical protein